ncbi:type IV pilin [Natrarchaeobaculum sulfurireducens]|uniref:Pilin/Flagellin, FlaG/FlaF family n=1 Tax=Natrarchaeobaculum sulfurireducens TaxID=2044521 RepID=A0A346PBA2_9EURY|nr:type IV pilin [Natrarchaeobaculum sulfurireducens]AXR76797.1 Pilin/Flagellin, FlaG/FlaF family [Natrarchaeobaculum sulfurireducens]AXR80467.1 hypothetical protein AArcMg_0444 [Natrarchaeobaculum sulfurireducens]
MPRPGQPLESDSRRWLCERGLSPLVGVLVLVAITVALAVVVAAGAASLSVGSAPPTAAFDLQADGESGEIAIDHVAGDVIDVGSLSVSVSVDETDLAMQPPVPFVGADGFDGTPDGAFNAEADPTWRTGERVSVTVAETNEPTLESGDAVTVTLSVDDVRVTTLETTAQ